MKIDTAQYNDKIIAPTNVDYTMLNMTFLIANKHNNNSVFACRISIADYYNEIINDCGALKNGYNRSLAMHQSKFKRATMSYKCHNVLRVNAKLFVGQVSLRNCTDQEPKYLLPSQKIENQQMLGLIQANKGKDILRQV